MRAGADVGEHRLDVYDDCLLLTVDPDNVNVCGQCPRLHVRLLDDPTPERLRQLAAGIWHLADHVEAEGA